MSLTPQQVAEQIIADLAQFSVADAVSAARARLATAGLVPTAEEPGALALVGEDAATVNELVARADELARIAKAATEEREQIKDLLRDTLGEREVLVVNGAPVATNKQTVSRILDQQWIKSAYPDVPGNENFYKDSVTRRFNFR